MKIKIIIPIAVLLIRTTVFADSCSDMAANEPELKFEFIAKCERVLNPIFDLNPQYSVKAPSDICLARIIKNNKTSAYQIGGKMAMYGVSGSPSFGNANAYLYVKSGNDESTKSIKLQDSDIGGDGAYFATAEYDKVNKTLVYRYSPLSKIDSPAPTPSEYYVSTKLSCTAY